MLLIVYQKLEDGTNDGRLRRDLCGLAFLIGKLPRQEGIDLGVRANAGTVADLMVDDITSDSGPFRNRVAAILDAYTSSPSFIERRAPPHRHC